MSTIEQIEEKPKSLSDFALAEFDAKQAALATVKSYATLTVAVDGIGKVEEAHKFVKRTSSDVEKSREEVKRPGLDFCRLVDKLAKDIQDEIEPVEKHLKSQRDAHDAEKLKEKKAKEAARAAVLQDRANKLAQAGCLAGDLAVLSAMTDDDFELHLRQESSKAARLRAEEAERKEAMRLQEEENNKERLRLEQVRQQMAAAAAEGRRKLEAEMAEQRRKAAEELEVLRRQQEAERQKLAAEQAEVARQQKEIRDRIEAERKAEQQREENARKAAAEAERLAKLEALKPEIEKAEAFGMALLTNAEDELQRIGAPSWADAAKEEVRRCGAEIVRIVRGAI